MNNCTLHEFPCGKLCCKMKIGSFCNIKNVNESLCDIKIIEPEWITIIIFIILSSLICCFGIFCVIHIIYLYHGKNKSNKKKFRYYGLGKSPITD